MNPCCVHVVPLPLSTHLAGVFVSLSLAVGSASAMDITLDGAAEGRTYEGHGAVSAGATTRLLIDYPEPQRSQILDYLFKPGYGAALQHLKVEIGGEVVSSAGTEPTHMRTAAVQNYQRGYEWWLMKEAKSRNPDIILDCLAWGAPGWIGGGNYWSQDMADYVANFIHGAKTVHDLDIEYTGVRNEVANDPAWIKTLRNTLDAAGLSHVKIVAGDEWNGTWNIVNDILADPVLSNAVAAVGAHYPSHTDHDSPASAKTLGQSLWGSEEGIGGDSWYAAQTLAKLYNRNYIVGKMTKSEIWSPITSYYDILTAPGSGLMRANQPWSGAYRVSPAIWATAHTTQFAQPGWIYLEGDASALLPGGGSVVTLKSDHGSDYSIVVETSDAVASQTINFHLTNGLSSAAMRVWKTTWSVPFVPVAVVTPSGGSFSYTFDPGCIYSMSTIGGQGRGSAVSPTEAAFPLPYVEGFESYAPEATPRYLSDQAGTFEVVTRTDGQGQCLRQVLPQQGIQWIAEWYPYTVAGDVNWQDYEVNADVMIETDGFVFLMGRIVDVPGFWDPVPRGYRLAVNNNPGQWEIRDEDGVLASGSVPFAPDVWHRLRLAFSGRAIRAYVDGVLVGEVKDGRYPSGMAAVGCGWHHARFDNVSIFPRHLGPENVAASASVSASTTWSADYAAGRAIDQRMSTRWSAAWPAQAEEWVELDFGASVRYNRSTLVEFSDHVTSFRIQHWDGGDWADDLVGGAIDTAHHGSFPEVTTSKARLLIDGMSATPSIFEFQLHYDPDPPNQALGASASASSVWQNNPVYTADKANDGGLSTRWAAAAHDGDTPWLELDFGAPTTFNKTITREFAERVTSYEIQAWIDGGWVVLSSGTSVGASRTDLFAAATAERVRFRVTRADNIPSLYEFEAYHDLASAPPVAINEWMVHNTTTVQDPADGQYASWFELYNPGSETQDLAGYFLTGDRTDRFQFRIPTGFVVPPGGHLLVWADEEPEQNAAGSDLHVNFSLVGASEIGVFAPDGSQVDVVDLRGQQDDRSDGSIPDGVLRILPTTRPSPRTSNNEVWTTSMEPGASPGTWDLAFRGIPDQAHRVEVSSNLTNVTWTELDQVAARPDGQFEYTDDVPGSSPLRIYRSDLP